MDQFLDALAKKGDQMVNDLKFIQNFDFDNATEEELEKFQEFLKQRLVDTEKTKVALAETQKKINESK